MALRGILRCHTRSVVGRAKRTLVPGRTGCPVRRCPQGEWPVLHAITQVGLLRHRARKTIRKCMRAKLNAIKAKLRKRMRDPVAETGAWVKQMLQGHLNYYAVSGNQPSMWCAGSGSRRFGDAARRPTSPGSASSASSIRSFRQSRHSIRCPAAASTLKPEGGARRVAFWPGPVPGGGGEQSSSLPPPFPRQATTQENLPQDVCFDDRDFQTIMLRVDVRRNGHLYWSRRVYGSCPRASRPRVHDVPRVRQ